jgi:TolB protein
MRFLVASWFPNGDLLNVGVQLSARDGPDNNLDAESFIEPDAIGQHRHIVYEGINEEPPQMAPNGASIVFEAERGPFDSTPPIGIEVFDIATMATRMLTHGDGQFVQAAWSPDGLQTAYACGKVNNKELQICVMDADGSNSRTVMLGAGSHQWPSWSPDGRHIAYQTDRFGADFRIAVMNADGTGVQMLTE